MSAVTYPQKEVSNFLNENFECVQINVASANRDEKSFMQSFHLLCSPGFVFMDHRGTDIRRAVGFRQPSELIADASMALGKISLLHLKPEDADKWFQHAYNIAREYETAPEALFWSGIAAVRSPNGTKDDLWSAWGNLRKEYPKSKWSTSADCRDYAPEGSK